MKNWAFGLIIVAIVLAASIYVFGKSNKDTGTSAKLAIASSTAPTSFSQIQTAVANGAQLLDVRTAEEYTAGHISGATNFSLQDMQAGKLPSGDKEQAIYLYCHSGNRASQAATILKTAGYKNIINLGAIAHVQAIGGKLVSGS